MPPLPLIKIAVLVGWSVVQLGVEAVKAKNLEKQLKLKEKEEKQNEKH